jgi:hypothetical protein
MDPTTVESLPIIALLEEAGISARSIALADPLKAICMQIFGVAHNLTPDVFYGSQDRKNAPIPQLEGWSGRKILQHIGTEGFRHIDPGIWPTHMISRARSLVREGYKVVFVSDVRFASEVDAIHANGGIVVRIVRPSVEAEAANQGIVGHVSETEMASLREDFVINNQDRSLEDLRALVKEFLCDRRFLVST